MAANLRGCEDGSQSTPLNVHNPDNTLARTHNQANELLTQDVTSAGAPDLDLAYDKAGNLHTQEVETER